ncbi:hypothetical protein N7462_005384 [Penicillium macrosclerotiorum]|uniref:uncharacterized protein n=1 Tax=Penicillium macrosclerotiorum TaxID=303699 RepID=UPI0025480C7C|nr:uncharacterized protein N7462_005384 [Penicillium macrosclerotiorum]KAJ5682219.1 hypothetical protein N7462_005384 [Penicillium macrosclerotiorum]
MSFLSRVVTLFGLVLLAHAGYSAHEHTVLFSARIATLPHDIIVETLVAVVVVSVGLVLGADKLKPVGWRDWAGEIERDGGARNPYLGLEERYGFWDVRAKRKEFADWIRGQDMVNKD